LKGKKSGGGRKNCQEKGSLKRKVPPKASRSGKMSLAPYPRAPRGAKEQKGTTIVNRTYGAMESAKTVRGRAYEGGGRRQEFQGGMEI